MTRSPSTIEIYVDGEDVTGYALFADTTFESVANALPGSCNISLKDTGRDLSFTTGSEIQCVIDNKPMWGGLLMTVGHRHFFPAVDTRNLASVKDRKWVLTGVDFNIWFDRRVLYWKGHELEIAHQPANNPGEVAKYVIAHYLDIPPGLDYKTLVATEGWSGKIEKGPIVGQGLYWREQMEDIGQYGPGVWFIDARKRLHLQPYADVVAPWDFTDYRPDSGPQARKPSIGMREMTVEEDGTPMQTQALLWGGHSYNASGEESTPSGTVFYKYPVAPANADTADWTTTDEDGNKEHHNFSHSAEKEQEALARMAKYGLWQMAEMHPGEAGFLQVGSLKRRAWDLLDGSTGADIRTGVETGLSKPIMSATCVWFGHDVPGKQHLEPNDIATFYLYTMGEKRIENGVEQVKPLIAPLPLRRLSMSFPALNNGDPYVRFEGEFGISYGDSRKLWKFLKKRAKKSRRGWITVADNDSKDPPKGAKARYYPLETPDGARTEFTLPSSYATGSTRVMVNGLSQRPNFEYHESDPGNGIITFYAAPFEDDRIFVYCET